MITRFSSSSSGLMAFAAAPLESTLAMRNSTNLVIQARHENIQEASTRSKDDLSMSAYSSVIPESPSVAESRFPLRHCAMVTRSGLLQSANRVSLSLPTTMI